MSESNSKHNSAPIAGARVLAWLGVCLIAGILLQTLLARSDRGNFSKLENFVATTAVGDSVFYPLPSPLPKTPAPVARVRGEMLVPVSYEKLDFRDSRMQPVARDPLTKLTIYESSEPLPEASAGKFFFVKIGANEYLKIQAAK